MQYFLLILVGACRPVGGVVVDQASPWIGLLLLSSTAVDPGLVISLLYE